MLMPVEERPCFALPHELYINTVVHQPLSSSDKARNSQEKRDGSRITSRHRTPPLNPELAVWTDAGSPGSNMAHINYNHTWDAKLAGFTHKHVHTNKLLVRSKVWVSHPVIAD